MLFRKAKKNVGLKKKSMISPNHKEEDFYTAMGVTSERYIYLAKRCCDQHAKIGTKSGLVQWIWNTEEMSDSERALMMFETGRVQAISEMLHGGGR